MKSVLESLLSGKDLSPDQTRESFQALMGGSLSEVQQAAFLVALRAKGESPQEIAVAAQVLREFAHSVAAPPGAVDTCGTGGDGSGTLNISTAAAILTASLGVPVAKHGNRSVSSRCGSADVLEAMGWPLALRPRACELLLAEKNFAFLFAPALHPAMKEVAPVRRALGVRTIFNLLGPLANPAGIKRQVVGAFSPKAMELLAHALAELGAEYAWVVHSRNGLDELSSLAPTDVVEVRGGKVVGRLVVDPVPLGLKSGEDRALQGADAKSNAARLWEILEGREEGPAAEAVALTTGAALLVAGRVSQLFDGVREARQALSSGAAAKFFREVLKRARELVDA